MTAPTVLSFFDQDTKSYSYVVADEGAGACAVINSVLDFDIKSGRTSTEGADALIAAVKERGWRTEWVLETHAHADHLTAAPYVKAQLGGKLGIGANIPTVQETFRAIYNLGSDFASDGRQFDRLFADGEAFRIGGLTARVMATPGHTPACITYVIGDAAFIGDTMFAPDYGTARCDFPGGDARTLYRSIQRILTCRRRRGSTSVTIIRRMDANPRPARPSPSNARTTCTSPARPRTHSSRCAKRATRPSTCPHCCCLPCRSTSAPAPCRPRKATASPT